VTPAPSGGGGDPGRRHAVRITALVFDLGGVLLDWDPRHVLRDHADDDDAVEELLRTVDIDGAQRALDLGTPLDDVHARWRKAHPDHMVALDDYFGRWHDTLPRQFDEVVEILDEVRNRDDLRVYVLSNFSGDLFRTARPRFAFLEWFDGLLISGDEGVIKPDPEVFEVLIDRFDLEPASTIFIDDRRENVEAARAAGLLGIHHISADDLRARLRAFGVL
jgi:2-haloacid dehalogenase